MSKKTTKDAVETGIPNVLGVNQLNALKLLPLLNGQQLTLSLNNPPGGSSVASHVHPVTMYMQYTIRF